MKLLSWASVQPLWLHGEEDRDFSFKQVTLTIDKEKQFLSDGDWSLPGYSVVSRADEDSSVGDCDITES